MDSRRLDALGALFKTRENNIKRIKSLDKEISDLKKDYELELEELEKEKVPFVNELQKVEFQLSTEFFINEK